MAYASCRNLLSNHAELCYIKDVYDDIPGASVSVASAKYQQNINGEVNLKKQQRGHPGKVL
jgi:hypothetical protein